MSVCVYGKGMAGNQMWRKFTHKPICTDVQPPFSSFSFFFFFHHFLKFSRRVSQEGFLWWTLTWAKDICTTLHLTSTTKPAYPGEKWEALERKWPQWQPEKAEMERSPKSHAPSENSEVIKLCSWKQWLLDPKGLTKQCAGPNCSDANAGIHGCIVTCVYAESTWAVISQAKEECCPLINVTANFKGSKR